jgi:hypothetical protein
MVALLAMLAIAELLLGEPPVGDTDPLAGLTARRMPH